MALSDVLLHRLGPAGRLPTNIDDFAGPVKGVVKLPTHLSWPGMRECDISDDGSRRSMYRLLLARGKRHDVLRFVNAERLAADWALIADSLDPKLRRWCERQFALGADRSVAEQAAEVSQGGAVA
jgi:hypothetical protein